MTDEHPVQGTPSAHVRLAVGYVSALAVVTASTFVARLAFGGSHLADVVMVLLLGVVIVSMRFGHGPSLVAAGMSALALEFFFIQPLYSFAISDAHDIITFAVMVFVAFVISHLTKRIRDQAADARVHERSIETERLRNALLSSVSHDLRTPLGVVTGATSALLEFPPEDATQRRALLVTAHGEALRLTRLVHNLLDMTRLEAGALNVRKELQPLEEVIGAALNRLEQPLRGREVGTSVPDDLPLVPLDSVLIEQVLINVIENAARHTPPGSPIDVEATEYDAELEIAVADRGPGIASRDLEHVFEKFWRLRETEGGGVGLGLTICRGIVRAHGGRMWVENRPGGGASFRFTLPLDPATETAHGRSLPNTKDMERS